MQTPSTTVYRRGDVVLVPFPFTDLSGFRNRPALVVSNDAHNQATGDLIIAQITGNVAGRPRNGDHYISEWQQAGLLAPSLVRAKLATLTSMRVRRAVGQMPIADMQAVEGNLRTTLVL